MRYLAIDLGTRRTGLAIGDDRTRLASPLEVIELPQGPQLVAALSNAVERHGPDALVVGLPLNMSGEEGPAAKSARAFGTMLGERLGLPVHFQDERLTSFAADQAMARSGRTRGQKKALRDALAAAEMLRDFLSREAAAGEGGAADECG